MRSFLVLQRVDLGFRPTGILSFETSLPPTRYSPPQHAATFDAILDRIRSLPGVCAAGAVNELPLGGGDFSWTFHAESSQAPQSSPLPVADYRIVTPGYFETLSIGLQRGRAFTEQDGAERRPVAIISESMARRYWPNEDPIDKRIRLDGPIARYPWLTIVGVVRDVHYSAIDMVPPPTLYRPLRQHAWPNMSIVIRSDGDARSMVAAVRAQVAEIDRELPLANIRDMPTIVSDSVAMRRFTLFLIASFASVALILALAGIYGVLSYMLSLRVQEFGIRMALGAAPVQMLSQIFWMGMRLVVAGIIIGALGSAAFGKVIAGLLYGVKSTDPLTYVVVTMTSTVVAAVACLVSSWRALRIDAITALRTE